MISIGSGAFQHEAFRRLLIYSKPHKSKIPTRAAPGEPSVSLSPTFFIAKTQQQRFKLIKGLLLIGPDRLEDNTGAAIQIGTKHFQYAGGREILIAFANRDLALEPDRAPDKLRRRSRVQPELVDNFDFFAHPVQSGGGSHQACLTITVVCKQCVDECVRIRPDGRRWFLFLGPVCV